MADGNALGLDVPRHLWYSTDHVWVNDASEPATLGITEYAADQLGEIVFADLPAVGTHVDAGEDLLQLESAKSVEPVIAPVSGTVRYVNPAVEADASVVNDDPYGEGWLVKIEIDDEEQGLLEAEQYEEMIRKG